MIDKTQSLEELNLPGYRLHRLEGMNPPRYAIDRLLSARTGVTPTMALRLGKYCGNGAAFWVRLQAAHDLWHAERELVEDLDQIPSRHDAA